MGKRERGEFVESIQRTHLAIDAILDLIRGQADPNGLEVVADPVQARAHRIYRELGNKGLVPIVEVTQDAVVSTMREAVLVAAGIAKEESGLR